MKSGKRGRPSKSETGETKVIIKDPLLEPFFIERDNNNYTLIKRTRPLQEGQEEDEDNKNFNKVMGYYTKFGSAIKKVSKLKTNLKSVGEITLDDYIKNWKKIQQDIEKLTLNLKVKA